MADPASYLGTRYKWGGTDKSGIDCSGLSCLLNPELPRTAREQYRATQRVSEGDLQPGDYVYLQGTQKDVPLGEASHVGVYDGAGNVIHASSKRGSVVRDSLRSFKSRGLLGYGRVGGMATSSKKQKTRGVSGPALNAYQQTPVTLGTPEPAYADPMATAQQVVGPLLNQPPPTIPQWYDPSAPRPGYNPSAPGVGSGQAGMPGAQTLSTYPYNDQGASPIQQSTTLAKQQIDQAAGPNAALIAQHEQDAARSKALADYLKATPAPEYQQEPQQPYPDQPQAAIPTRPAPRLDPLSGVLATLAGFADPQHAGQYGQAPLQAGLGQADQAYQDSLQHYSMLAQQMQQHYEHELAKRNDLAHYLHEKAGVNYTNATARDARALQTNQLEGDQGYGAGIATALGGIDTQNRNAARTGVDLGQVLSEIKAGQEQNALKLSAYQEQQKSHGALLDHALTFLGHGLTAQGAMQRSRDTQAGENLRNLRTTGASTANSIRTQAGENKRNTENRLSREKMAGNRITSAEKIAGWKAGIDAANPNGIQGITRLETLHLQHLQRAAEQAANRASIERGQLRGLWSRTPDAQNTPMDEWADSHMVGSSVTVDQAIATLKSEYERINALHGGTPPPGAATGRAPIIQGNGFSLTPR